MTMDYQHQLDAKWGPVHTDIHEVKEVDEDRVLMADHWSMARKHFPADVKEGDIFVVQTVKGSIPVMVAKVHWHQTAEDLDADHAAFVEKMDREHLERLEANREDWATREALLPAPLRARLENFREKAGAERFDKNGWGYELVVSELAAALAANGGDEMDQLVTAYCEDQGVSGNQFEFARMLAKGLNEEMDNEVANSISALAPLGVGAYWENS